MVGNLSSDISVGLTKALTSLRDLVPVNSHPYFNLAFFIVLLTIYSIFVWKFHKFISKRDIFEINLHQYNKVDHPLLNKVVAVLFFLIEYLVILPAIVFFWFFIMALMLLFLAKDYPLPQLILISACIVGVIRIISYYKQTLAEEITKQFPLALLVISLTSSEFFNLDKTILKVSLIPQLLSSIIIYLLFILILEFILRIYHVIANYNRINK